MFELHMSNGHTISVDQQNYEIILNVAHNAGLISIQSATGTITINPKQIVYAIRS